ncbi:YciI family protein [Spirillospora sp. CA-294931]|uniref:YciI family protein n=1 Tax=Spirillospora sp. CA-294931 TaxID=3240042 RepID=UPI003D91DBD3
MKYIIMLYGSQREYDALTGKADDAWTAEEVAALHRFMGDWNNELVESGEFVEARGLSAPVHARRIEFRNGAPVVTDGPYPETEEVLAGYTVVECESFDRATEIAMRVTRAPAPAHAPVEDWFVDVRPLDEEPPRP